MQTDQSAGFQPHMVGLAFGHVNISRKYHLFIKQAMSSVHSILLETSDSIVDDMMKLNCRDK